MDKSELREMINDSDMVLVGLGEEFECVDEEKSDRVREAYLSLMNLLNGKNHFIMTSCKDTCVYESGADRERIVAPLMSENEYQNEEDYDKRWGMYSKWLGGTLNKRILVLELGVLFGNPAVIRWPFEKIAFLNEKASFVRINKSFPQLSEEVSKKGISVEMNAVDFLLL